MSADHASRETADASATVLVAASADEVYGWLTDLDVLAGFGEEVQQMRWTSGEVAAPGATFSGANRNGVRRWTTTCTVTDAEPGRRFGWRVSFLGVPIARWQYAVVPVDAATCEVTESTWDERRPLLRPLAGLATGRPDRTATNQVHIEATLRRVQRYAEALGSG